MVKRISLADVARAAGVGKATASRALSGQDEVGAATRERILDVASSMGYQPNRSARALRTGRYDVVALFVPLELPAIGEVLRVAAQCAADAGYQLLVGSRASLDRSDASAQLGGMSIDGACLVESAESADGTTELDADIPLVHTTADAQATRLAMTRLLEQLGERSTARPG
ncbi:MAG TPA: LacI family DNA-binding transcriptional regulator [Flexivirga sp.]|uniref:LacI family DNA-binding transcriptional regulator n=1 Tax=Flexivirga sp. TaxID=1962927 RepID=UPI002BAC8051|nr:LacI family DNA-binding transcriptional regulator [Flexivirga sp.]HWC21931.1 LacI family DNA-binding transcriptional regulator [Flexivirga sp.]